MTQFEFEQRVAEALARRLEGAYLPAHGISLMLAPCVAAAIEVLIEDLVDYDLSAAAGDELQGQVDDELPGNARAKALKALRGES